ncbi:MAG: 3-demethylubiquinone-9 3-O-methyltransferase [Chloroflexi bacterium]|nr:3-demethylubiquinone-9 3-O-methyltransferase [Chloroflexota bacterium]
MPVDNEWYHDLGDAWWDPEGVVGPLHEINPVRVEYFCGVLGDLTGQRLLEIGCGGGLMAEEYAKRGASITAVDRSAASIATAAQHARASGLKIAYAPSVGERLPFNSGSFDAVLSADTLEHVDDVDLVVSEAARVLRPGGRFVYDTVNRTWKSRLLLVWLPQNVFHIAPPDTHEYARFIKPEELQTIMARHGLQNCETRGLALKRNPIAAGISFARTRKLGGFQIGDDTGMSYVGYAEKAA